MRRYLRAFVTMMAVLAIVIVRNSAATMAGGHGSSSGGGSSHRSGGSHTMQHQTMNSSPKPMMFQKLSNGSNSSSMFINKSSLGRVQKVPSGDITFNQGISRTNLVKNGNVLNLGIGKSNITSSPGNKYKPISGGQIGNLLPQGQITQLNPGKNVKPIDPGFGAGGGNSSKSKHHHHHHHCHYDHGWHWFAGCGYPYPTYPIPIVVGVPVVVTNPVSGVTQTQGGPQLVDGIDLQLVDVRLVDAGNPEKNLGPRFRVVVGNHGKEAAGNFQVLLIAAKDQQVTPDLPSMMVDVEGVAAGQVAQVEMRLPMEAMTVADGQPFNVLAVAVDANKLIDEVSEEDNAGMVERPKIKRVNTK